MFPLVKIVDAVDVPGRSYEGLVVDPDESLAKLMTLLDSKQQIEQKEVPYWQISSYTRKIDAEKNLIGFLLREAKERKEGRETKRIRRFMRNITCPAFFGNCWHFCRRCCSRPLTVTLPVYEITYDDFLHIALPTEAVEPSGHVDTAELMDEIEDPRIEAQETEEIILNEHGNNF